MSHYIDGSIESLRAKIKSIRFGMFTTVADDFTLSSRPMTQQAVEDDGTLWFFTSDDTDVARDITRHSTVNVSFAEPNNSLYVSISGEAVLVKDQQKFRELWNPLVAAWYPQGINDPHLTLIKFTVDSAEYWDSDTNKMTQFFSLAKAALTGKQPKSMGTHAKIQF